MVSAAAHSSSRDDPLFPTRIGRRLSEDAVEARVATPKAVASQRCPSLGTKGLTPHVLRHTCAMTLLRQGADVAVIALWLGHADIRSTDAYLHADMTIKERALARMTPPFSKPGTTARRTASWRYWQTCDYPDHASAHAPT